MVLSSCAYAARHAFPTLVVRRIASASMVAMRRRSSRAVRAAGHASTELQTRLTSAGEVSARTKRVHLPLATRSASSVAPRSVGSWTKSRACATASSSQSWTRWRSEAPVDGSPASAAGVAEAMAAYEKSARQATVRFMTGDCQVKCNTFKKKAVSWRLAVSLPARRVCNGISPTHHEGTVGLTSQRDNHQRPQRARW